MELRRNVFTFVFTCMLIVFCSVSFFDFKTKAKEQEEETFYKYYKTVSIAQNDTLWNFAEQYADDRFYEDYQTYIAEVMRINSLDSSDITKDCHLILPYYSLEFKE